MQFTKFGQTGLTVCRMILGTGTFGKQTDEKEAHRMLGKAAEAGSTSSIPLKYIPLARRSVVLKSSQAAGSTISGQGLSSPQRAAEKWGRPLGMQAARENTKLNQLCKRGRFAPPGLRACRLVQLSILRPESRRERTNPY